MSWQRVAVCGAVVILSLMSFSVEAHRSGCHRWHSCTSDHGTYVCGDTGHCSQCPDNEYCKAGHPQPRAKLQSKQNVRPSDGPLGR